MNMTFTWYIDTLVSRQVGKGAMATRQMLKLSGRCLPWGIFLCCRHISERISQLPLLLFLAKPYRNLSCFLSHALWWFFSADKMYQFLRKESFKILLSGISYFQARFCSASRKSLHLSFMCSSGKWPQQFLLLASRYQLCVLAISLDFLAMFVLQPQYPDDSWQFGEFNILLLSKSDLEARSFCRIINRYILNF